MKRCKPSNPDTDVGFFSNFQHGAVVMLYHPCARKDDVEKLKAIVEGCIRRHVITPYNKMPLAEVSGYKNRLKWSNRSN